MVAAAVVVGGGWPSTSATLGTATAGSVVGAPGEVATTVAPACWGVVATAELARFVVVVAPVTAALPGVVVETMLVGARSGPVVVGPTRPGATPGGAAVAAARTVSRRVASRMAPTPPATSSVAAAVATSQDTTAVR